MQRSDVVTTAPPQADGENGAGDGIQTRLSVMTLEEFVQRMPHVQPPCAYRLSLDSGVEFNNVKHAFEQPLAVRLDTWLRLLRSLGVGLVAAARSEDVASDDPSVARVLIGATPDDAEPLLAPSRQSSLQDCRRARNLSMAALAHQIGVSIDTVTVSCGVSVFGFNRPCMGLNGRHEHLPHFLAMPQRHVMFFEVAGHSVSEEAKDVLLLFEQLQALVVVTDVNLSTK